MYNVVSNFLSKNSLRLNELNCILNNLSSSKDKDNYISVSKEYSNLNYLINLCLNYINIIEELQKLNDLSKDIDDDIRKLALEEIVILERKKIEFESIISSKILKKNEITNKSIFFELRSATGGNESAIFVGDLFRMYTYYFTLRKWKTEIMNSSVSNLGGYKEVILRVIGKDAYSRMKYESGIHRVQRVPKTECQGRVHTSTCTVAVLPELDIIDSIDINLNDLRIDTFRSSGAGGQHVNRTDSAVRITHIPSKIVVECQDERSQHKNKAKAMSLLRSKLLASEQEKQKTSFNDERKLLVGTGSRSEKVRTYNYIDNRVTDHRSNITLYRLSDILDGNLDLLIDNLIRINANLIDE